eukprot:TRINITY_DN2606_c0_g1_i3.p1 TRINITY_DN2606_c0_g1~~TRINITY_DN2606_c0_g1_i3.p1  ORF type:complete len:872 (-),score=212.27 TRINITY_DN2606_c0_g1_i3:48-2663(-)
MMSYHTRAYAAPAPVHIPVKPKPKQRIRVSYNVQANDPHQRHCFGVNAMALGQDGSLYTGGRDSVIHQWQVTGTPTHTKALRHHTDWVNDMLLCKDMRTLVSCSSDTSVKLWNTSSGTCIRTLNRHADYVKAIAYSPAAERLCSASLDGHIYVWDVAQCAEPVVAMKQSYVDPRTQVPPQVRAGGDMESFYSLAINGNGNLIVSGSTARVVRAWDARTGDKLFKLKGHQDNVKALAVSGDGRLCVSGSSDSTWRVWDLRTQRCVHVYELHDDSVWSLAVDNMFSTVYSGGRDGQIFATRLATRESTLVAREAHPILKITLAPKGWRGSDDDHVAHGDEALWVAIADSSVHRWAIEGLESSHKKVPFSVSSLSASPHALTISNSNTQTQPSMSPPDASHPTSTPHPEPSGAYMPALSAPDAIIPGRPGVVRHHIMNNRRHVLTKDNTGRVELWDITRCARLAEYGVVSFEDKMEELNETISVPNWFTIDVKTGSIHVNLDSPQCFTAEAYAVDAGFSGVDPEVTINLGERMISALMEPWARGKKDRVVREPPEPEQHRDKDKDIEKDKPKDKSKGKTGLSPKLSRVSPETMAQESGREGEDTPSMGTPSSATPAGHSTPAFQTAGTNNVPPLSLTGQGSLPAPPQPAFNVPTDTSLIISDEITGATLYRSLVSDLDGSEPDDVIPNWVYDCLVYNQTPATRENAAKVGFFLSSFDESTLPTLPHGNTRLNAPKLLRIKKVALYVANKLDLELPTRTTSSEGAGPTPGTPDTPSSSSSSVEDSDDTVDPGDFLEILCNGRLVPPAMNLATVKAFFWRQGDDMVLQYRVSARFLAEGDHVGPGNSKGFRNRLRNLRRGSNTPKSPAKPGLKPLK